jgi:hypothetical protein
MPTGKKLKMQKAKFVHMDVILEAVIAAYMQSARRKLFCQLCKKLQKCTLKFFLHMNVIQEAFIAAYMQSARRKLFCQLCKKLQKMHMDVLHTGSMAGCS